MKIGKNTFVIFIAILQALSLVLMGVWVRMMNESFTTYQQIFWRFFLAAVLVWILFGHKFNKTIFKELSPKDWSIYVIRAGLNYGLGVLFFTVAVLHTKLSVVSFISSLPIMGLLAWLMFREKLDKRAIPLILISVVGLALISGITPTSFSLGLGAGAAIISMLGFDTSWLMVRFHKKSLTNFHNTTLMLSFAWIIPLILLLFKHQAFIPKHINDVAWIGLFLSVVLNITGVYILNYIFLNLKGYVAGNILLVEGIFAVIVGYFVYNEKVNLNELIGAIIIIVCALLISRIGLSTKTKKLSSNAN